MLSSVPTIDCRLLITCVIRRGDQCVGYLMVTLPTPQRASLHMGARETPSPRGAYGSLMCSRTSQLASVRYQTELPSCGRTTKISAEKRQNQAMPLSDVLLALSISMTFAVSRAEGSDSVLRRKPGERVHRCPSSVTTVTDFLLYRTTIPRTVSSRSV